MSRFAARRTATRTLVVLAFSAAAASATTIVPMLDSALADQARLIVVAETEGILPVVAERPTTDYLMRVERVLKGTVDSSALVVRVLGGTDPEGRELRIYGAPRFAVGEQALLFLSPAADGTWRIQQFMQGAFHRARAAGREVAYRDESEVVRLEAPTPDERQTVARDFGLFTQWIADRAAGESRRPDYFFRPDPQGYRALTESFTYFQSAGLNLRWFSFDSGGAVPWKAHRDGQPGLASGGFAEFQRALAAWVNEPQTPIKLTYGGTTSATAGFDRYDNQNVILFDDPNGEIEGTFACATGGTLAIGGPWSDPEVTGNFNGKRYVKIQGGDIIMNDGIECRLQTASGSKLAEEVYAHELGHTLGLGHSSEDENEANATLRNALMYFRAHGDGRGARLESDDLAAIRGLYQKSGGGGGGGGGTAGCPAGTLCLLDNRFEVTLTWNNQFNGATGTGKPILYSNFAGFFYFDSDPRAIELIVKIVDYDGTILVFFSQLTVIKFEMTVTDKRTGKVKRYSNTADDCGAVDPDFINSDGTTALLVGGAPTQITDLGITRAGKGKCAAGPGNLCLLNKRFSVTMPSWTNQFNGTTGSGNAKAMNDLTGGFHFSPDARDLEILFKLNQFPDRILVFTGSLSVFDYTLDLTDETTGRTTRFHNPAGTFCGAFINDLLAGPPF